MFGFLKGGQPKTLRINGVEGELTVEKKETLLQAALRQGVRFPHSCRVGGCATCKCRLVDGKVKELTESAYILSEKDLAEGYVLGCQAVPKTDVSIEIPGLDQQRKGHPVVKTEGVIEVIRPLTHDISEVQIRLDQPLEYMAGQYALLRVPGLIDEPRAYSFADAPRFDGNHSVSFYIRAVPGGRMSGWFGLTENVGNRVQVEGPFGDFYLREGTAPVLCIAGGSGLAPIKSLLDDALNYKTPREIVFLFGARTRQDLYKLEHIDQLEKEWAGASFTFVPVLSEEPEGSDWKGARGLVTDLIVDYAHPHMQVYMCGPPAMLDAAEAALTDYGISVENIFADRFVDKSFLKTA